MPTSLSSYSCYVVVVLALTGQFGCIAMNIPSERLHDPGDHGGLLGDWDHDSERINSCNDGHCAHPSQGFDTCAFDGGPLDSDPLDPTLDCDGTPKAKKKKESIPWPRFHPVPTRPVFGTEPAFPAGM